MESRLLSAQAHVKASTAELEAWHNTIAPTSEEGRFEHLLRQRGLEERLDTERQLCARVEAFVACVSQLEDEKAAGGGRGWGSRGRSLSA